jgi:ribosome biogenesis protein Tsr3
VVVKDCTDKKLDKMKKEQKERKKKEGQNVDLVQNSDDEISSSDEEALDKKGKQKKFDRTKVFEALEDPSQALKDIIPGHKERKEREQRETEEDAPERNGEASGI